MRIVNAIALSLLIAGCMAPGLQHLVPDPVAAIEGALPAGWVLLEVKENTYPSYRPEGNGKALFIGQGGKEYLTTLAITQMLTVCSYVKWT